MSSKRSLPTDPSSARALRLPKRPAVTALIAAKAKDKSEEVLAALQKIAEKRRQSSSAKNKSFNGSADQSKSITDSEPAYAWPTVRPNIPEVSALSRRSSSSEGSAKENDRLAAVGGHMNVNSSQDVLSAELELLGGSLPSACQPRQDGGWPLATGASVGHAGPGGNDKARSPVRAASSSNHVDSVLSSPVERAVSRAMLAAHGALAKAARHGQGQDAATANTQGLKAPGPEPHGRPFGSDIVEEAQRAVDVALRHAAQAEARASPTTRHDEQHGGNAGDAKAPDLAGPATLLSNGSLLQELWKTAEAKQAAATAAMTTRSAGSLSTSPVGTTSPAGSTASCSTLRYPQDGVATLRYSSFGSPSSLGSLGSPAPTEAVYGHSPAGSTVTATVTITRGAMSNSSTASDASYGLTGSPAGLHAVSGDILSPYGYTRPASAMTAVRDGQDMHGSPSGDAASALHGHGPRATMLPSLQRLISPQGLGSSSPADVAAAVLSPPGQRPSSSASSGGGRASPSPYQQEAGISPSAASPQPLMFTTSAYAGMHRPAVAAVRPVQTVDGAATMSSRGPSPVPDATIGSTGHGQDTGSMSAPASARPGLTSIMDQARVCKQRQSLLRAEVSALLSQSSTAISSLCQTLVARVKQADEEHKQLGLQRAEVAAECVRLHTAVSECDTLLELALQEREGLLVKVNRLEGQLARHVETARAMRDSLAEATGCVRVVLRIRPLLPSDARPDSQVGVLLRWLLDTYCARARMMAKAIGTEQRSNGAATTAAGMLGQQPLVSLAGLVRLLGWRGDAHSLCRAMRFDPDLATGRLAAVQSHPVTSPSKAGGSGSSSTSGSHSKAFTQARGKDDMGSERCLDAGPVALITGTTTDDLKTCVVALPDVPLSAILRPAPQLSMNPSGGPADWSAAVSAGSTAFASKVASMAASDGTAYYFDRVFGPSAGQDDVWQEVAPTLSAALRGKGVTVVAYGATGSGKSHSLFGTGVAHGHKDGHKSQSTSDQTAEVGLVPKALGYLLAALQAEGPHPHHGASAAAAATTLGRTLSMSVLEVYGEQVNDLLAMSLTGGASGKAGGGSGGRAGPAVESKILQDTPAVLVPVTSLDTGVTLLQDAVRLRAEAGTLSNGHSSRGHVLVRLCIKGGPRPFDGEFLGRSLHGRATDKSSSPMDTWVQLCDLAGAERVQESGAAGSTLAEACAVNASLSALTSVIQALAKGSPHVPYRASKLTRLLEPSLSSKASRILFITTVSAVPVHRAASHAALKVAAQVAGTPVRRPVPQDVAEAILALLKQEKTAD